MYNDQAPHGEDNDVAGTLNDVGIGNRPSTRRRKSKALELPLMTIDAGQVLQRQEIRL